MGKKENWFTALKKAFTSSSKDSITNSTEKSSVKEKKKWSIGTSKHGNTNPFIPLYREPSSVEKILGDAERELQRHVPRQEAPKKLEQFRTYHQESSLISTRHHETRYEVKASRELSRNLQGQKHVARKKRVVTQNMARVSAIRIQAAYRGYMARKSYRALKGLIRLQRVMRGQSVKRQTTNTMRCMQLLVKVQNQVRARRLQMLENRNQTPQRGDKDVDTSFGKWSLTPQETDGNWDDSTLTKEEKDARTQRKVEAVIKRERALAYAYSHQLLKVTPKSAHAVLTDIRFGGFPLWWNWLDRQVPHEPNPKTPTAITPKFFDTRNQPRKQVFHEVLDVPTPRSSITMMPTPKAKRSSKKQLRDDESLTSCPGFAQVPNYMTPTVSAKAKIRDTSSTSKDREGKKKFSFNLTQSIGSMRLFAPKETAITMTAAKRRSQRHRSSSSIGGFSVDSTVSLPVGVGRRPFK